MSYHGDIRLGDTIDIQFTTTAAATGLPTQLAGTPVISAYIGNSTTQLTAGITLTVDLDGVTGLNNVRVVASGGNGYATATNVTLVITTGTVGGTSAVGYVVGSFSIECRSALMATASAVKTVNVSTTGGIGATHSGTAASIANGNIALASGHGITSTTIFVRLTGGTNAVGKGRIGTYSSGDTFTVDPAWNATVNGLAETLPSGTITYEVYAIPPSGSTYNVGQSGDNFARLGAPAGASHAADNAAIKADTAAILVDTGTTLDGRIPAALVGGRMDANMGAISTDSAAADNAEAFFDGTGYAGTNNVIPTVTTATNVTTVNGLAANVITAAATAADFTTEIQSGLATAATLATVLALLDDARGEPGQGSPPVNPDLVTKIDYLYKAWRNRSTQTASEYALYADDGTTKDHEAACSSDGTTLVRGEVTTGA